MSKRLKSFTVMAKVHIDCGISIRAESLEDALDKSKNLGETDFVTVLGDFNDGKLSITGVFEDE